MSYLSSQGSKIYAEEDAEKFQESEVVSNSNETVYSRHNKDDSHMYLKISW